MRIEYDKEVDALYIKLRDGNIADTQDINEGVTLDIDDNGLIIGIEILDASERLTLSDIESLTIEDLQLKKITFV
ncbi:hypothetical protein MCHI_003029 [Candidatus Magnetoovum chiemensis]|nr:hypothetical protein MCHI_003029 [Candidatus Magnetoovum chiemensis]